MNLYMYQVPFLIIWYDIQNTKCNVDIGYIYWYHTVILVFSSAYMYV